MLFPDLAISDDYQSSNSTKHTLSLTETFNSFYDYIAHISLIFKEKLLLNPISIKIMYIEHSLISVMPIFIFWSNICAKTQVDCLLLNYSYFSIFSPFIEKAHIYVYFPKVLWEFA